MTEVKLETPNVKIESDEQRAERLCGPVVRVPDYRSRGPGSIPDATRFYEK
jgi:hypothetical protein